MMSLHIKSFADLYSLRQSISNQGSTEATRLSPGLPLLLPSPRNLIRSQLARTGTDRAMLSNCRPGRTEWTEVVVGHARCHTERQFERLDVATRPCTERFCLYQFVVSISLEVQLLFVKQSWSLPMYCCLCFRYALLRSALSALDAALLKNGWWRRDGHKT